MLVLRPITLIEHNLRGGRKIQRDPTQTYHRGGAGDIKVMSHLMFGVLVWRQVNECDCCNSAAEEPATRHPKRCGYGMVLPVAGRAPRLLRCQPLKDRSIQISCQGRRNSQQGLYGTCRAADTSGVLTPCREFPFRSISTWHRSHSLFRSYRFLRFISAFFLFLRLSEQRLFQRTIRACDSVIIVNAPATALRARRNRKSPHYDGLLMTRSCRSTGLF
jgi:hypothetical protein